MSKKIDNDNIKKINDISDREITLVILDGEECINYCKHFYLEFKSILNIKRILSFSCQSEPEWISVLRRNGEDLYFGIFQEKLEGEGLLIICFLNLEQRAYFDKYLYIKGFEWGKDYIDSLYVMQYYRQKYDLDIQKKNIWIFGAGSNGKNFYEKYKDIYSINGFVSNYEEETEYLGLPVIRPSELKRLNNIYIVICSFSEEIIVNSLLTQGLIGYEQYCFPDTLPKKLFVAIGSCQVRQPTRILLSKNNNFCSIYDVYLYFENMYVTVDIADYIRSKEYGEFCDVVFYNKANVGTSEGRDYELLINDYYTNARKIYMPFYYFTGQHMQATKNVNPYCVQKPDIYTNEVYFWFRGDEEINKMIEQDVPCEEIVKAISSEQYWTEEEILCHFKRELKKIEVLDRFSSIKIKEFIEKNYQKELVFLDGTHFSIRLVVYLANQIANILNIPTISEDKVVQELGEEKKSNMPVYPCVRKALKMNISEECEGGIFYNIKLGKAEYVDFKEYIRRYIEYVQNIKNIFLETGTFIEAF